MWVSPCCKENNQFGIGNLEKTESISLFLKLWNEVLAEVKGEKGYKFNPCGIVCDNAGAMENAVQDILKSTFFQKEDLQHAGGTTSLTWPKRKIGWIL